MFLKFAIMVNERDLNIETKMVITFIRIRQPIRRLELNLKNKAPSLFTFNNLSNISVLFLQGALVTACADDTLHLWNLRQRRPAVLHSLKFNRERQEEEFLLDKHQRFCTQSSTHKRCRQTSHFAPAKGEADCQCASAYSVLGCHRCDFPSPSEFNSLSSCVINPTPSALLPTPVALLTCTYPSCFTNFPSALLLWSKERFSSDSGRYLTLLLFVVISYNLSDICLNLIPDI